MNPDPWRWSQGRRFPASARRRRPPGRSILPLAAVRPNWPDTLTLSRLTPRAAPERRATNRRSQGEEIAVPRSIILVLALVLVAISGRAARVETPFRVGASAVKITPSLQRTVFM